MGRKAFTLNARVPDRGHRSALYKKQHDLYKVTSCTESNDHPEKRRKVLSSPANDP